MATRRPFWLPFTAGAAFSLLVFYLLSTFSRSPQSYHPTYFKGHRSKSEFRAPRPNVWSELNHDEVAELYDFLYNKQSTLNLTKSPRGYGKENYVTEVEVLRPNKSDVLNFQNHGNLQPERYARISVVESGVDEAFICEYKVGPFPPSDKTESLPLRYPHAHNRHCIKSPITDIGTFFISLLNIGYDVKDVTQDLLGGEVNVLDPFDPDALWLGARPSTVEDGRMVCWLEFFRNGPGSDGKSLLPQGLYTKLEISSPDPTTWNYTEWSYNGIIYPNLDIFREAWRSSNFTKSPINQDGRWTDTEDFTCHPPGRNQPPPLSIQPFGPRYQLDKNTAYISWMGFTFYLATSSARALSLHDIRYNNTRLIYELALQEALAHYAGSEPMQSGLEFLDTYFGMGSKMFSLVPGHDCPAYADYLPMTYHTNGQTFINKNAICIFEYTSDAPLQRHTSEYEVTVSRNTYLVVRSVSTVGNYDYTIDYLFYLDGSIEVKVRASGYIFAAYAPSSTPPPPPPASSPKTHSTTRPNADDLRPRSPSNPNHAYGHRIHPSTSTSMHDHVLLFRADIDLIHSSHNTFTTTKIQPLTTIYPWDLPSIPSRNTMSLISSPLLSEAGLDWPANSGGMYLISSNETNKWGEKRSFRIQPGTGMGTPSHLTILNSTSLGRSALWAEHDVWVLRQHDSEPLAAHENNYLDPNSPLVDFGMLANGEKLITEKEGEGEGGGGGGGGGEGEGGGGDDLVVLFNLGCHHVPHSGDIPNTLMHTSASSVVLSPFNFFDGDVSLGLRQGVRVDGRGNERKGGWERGVRWFGGRYGGEKQMEGDGEAGWWKGLIGKGKEGKVGGEVIELVVSRDLEPGLEGYFEEDERGAVVKNRVGGGLLGLYGSRDDVKAKLKEMKERDGD